MPEPANAPVTERPLAAEPVYRPSDTRPKHDAAKLAQFGIHKYESRRLILYTDIDPEIAKTLPPLVDGLYESLEAYFGPLPPDREKADFQITGYLMKDRDLFKMHGLLPEDLPHFWHGRHRGAEFWMNDQVDAYYRRHLLLHESTHCFMTIVPNPMLPLVWYMEGMAELFATHVIDNEGTPYFRIFPDRIERFRGLGRIRMIQDEVQLTGPRSLATLLDTPISEWAKNDMYAWSWALCQFLDRHPRYHERFQHIQSHVSAADPFAGFVKIFAEDGRDLNEEWLLFAAHICEGYDIDRTVIDFKDGKPLTEKGSGIMPIVADRGWQSTGVLVEAGHTYEVVATGRFTVAQLPRPWECEPQGVSIRYCDGKPLGMLVGTIRGTAPPSDKRGTTMLDIIPIGREKRFQAPVSGTLYLRINEFWNELSDNRGSVAVTIREVPGP